MHKSRVISFFIFMSLSLWLYFGVATSKKPMDPLLLELEGKYASSEGTIADVKKISLLGILKKKRESQGEILIKPKGKLFLKLSPPKLEIVMDGTHIWSIQYPEKSGLSDKVQVLKTKQDMSQILISFLSGGKDFFDHFNIQEKIPLSGAFKYKLIPKTKNPNFESVELVVGQIKKDIQELTYEDTLKNKVSYKFKNTKWNQKISNSQFTYKPPKNAVVTEAK